MVRPEETLALSSMQHGRMLRPGHTTSPAHLSLLCPPGQQWSSADFLQRFGSPNITAIPPSGPKPWRQSQRFLLVTSADETKQNCDGKLEYHSLWRMNSFFRKKRKSRLCADPPADGRQSEKVLKRSKVEVWGAFCKSVPRAWTAGFILLC